MKGKRALVTGANSGVGKEVVRALALAGAEVLMAVRNLEKGEAALADLQKTIPGAALSLVQLDLASLESVKEAADGLLKEGKPLDILVNNGGVMAPPIRQVTKDGFEYQFGVNYLAHFALTGRLLPLLQKSTSPRVTTLSSVAAAMGAKFVWENLQQERKYNAGVAYGQSKLACLAFGIELNRLSRAKGWKIASFASHPGGARTNLQTTGVSMSGPVDPKTTKMFENMMKINWMFQDADEAAKPSLYAVASADAIAGGYYGPAGFGGFTKGIKLTKPSKKALVQADIERLWKESERLTGVKFG